MKMVNIFKPLLRLRKRQDNYRKCLLPVSRLLIRRLLWSSNNWLLCQLMLLSHHPQRMMVTRKLLRKLRLRWLLLRLKWTRDLQIPIIELLKWPRKMPICQTSELWLTFTVPSLTWVR